MELGDDTYGLEESSVRLDKQHGWKGKQEAG